MTNRNILKQIAFDGLFIALIAVFSFVPNIGYITIGPISFTFIHVFVIFGAALFGWKRGLIYGICFGLFSLFKAINYPSTADFLFVNPFVSILPRALFGLISGLSFDFLKKKVNQKTFNVLLFPLSGILTFLHSLLTLTCLYVFGYLNVFNISGLLGLSEIIDKIASNGTLLGFIGGALGFGMVGEIIAAIIIVSSLYLIVYNRYGFGVEANKINHGGKKMDFKKILATYNDSATKDLASLIQINSVYDESTITKENPYGQGVHNAMAFMNELAKKEGFSVDLCDGHCIEISYGEGTQEIGVFAHLDVVPVTGKWTYPEFGAEIHDGIMYGRGTSDDKGPAMAAFYAIKALKDNNLIKGYKIKLVLGGDEERGSSCLSYYFDVLKKPQVTYGFTPDGDFPLIYGEKGICDYIHSIKGSLGPVKEIKAGVVPNAVIDSAVVTLENGSLLKEYLTHHEDVKYNILKEDNDLLTIEFLGVSAHGSTPEKGINAGLIMCKVLNEVYHIEVFEKILSYYSDYNGKGLGEYYETRDIGPSTYNIGIITYTNNELKIYVNFRYPENVDCFEVFKSIEKKTGFKTYTEDKPQKVVYFDPRTNDFIKVLHKVYVNETGDTVNQPMVIGGGTYAKEAENIIAFGSHFPGREDNIHGINEKIHMEDFLSSMPIYAHAIYELGNLKK